MLIDPCYAWEDDYRDGEEPTGLPYDATCRQTLSEKGYGPIRGLTISPDAGFAASTLYGDGEYAVFAVLDKNGRIRKLMVNFDPEDEEDE